MATRTETRFGAVASLGSTYTLLATIAAATTCNLLLAVTNRTANTVNLRAYIATSGWSSGEPTVGGNLIAAIAYDTPIAGGDVIQFSGYILNAGEQLVVYAGTASSLDIVAAGVAIT